MKILLTVFHLGHLVTQFYPATVDLALKVKHLLELDPDIKVNVEHLTTKAIVLDDATKAAVAAWKQKLGLT